MLVKGKHKTELINIILNKIPECTIYLFGSRATGKARIGSDIDLALDAGKPIPFKTLLALQVAIEDTTIPMHVDLVDLNEAPPELKKEILQKGEKWTP